MFHSTLGNLCSLCWVVCFLYNTILFFILFRELWCKLLAKCGIFDWLMNFYCMSIRLGLSQKNLELCLLYVDIYIFCSYFFLFFFFGTHLCDIKYSFLLQMICTQLYGFNNSCLILINYTQRRHGQLSISYRSYGNQTWPIKWNAVSSKQWSCRYCYMDTPLRR